MKKSRGYLIIICTILVIAALGYVCTAGIGEEKSGSVEEIKLGLDLAGGVSITYQAIDSNPAAEDMSDTIYKLQKRVENYSTEATVYQEGTNRINIEIPGVSDANVILEELGSPGSLTFETSDGEVVLSGINVANAKAGTQTTSLGTTEYVVQLTLDAEGSELFSAATAANIGNIIYIRYDGETISSPVVQTTITGGEAVINGMESYEEAETLAATIRIGALSLELEEIRSNVVGAQLGEEALQTSLQAGLIGVLIIFLLMCAIYRLPGLASSLSLIVYIGLTLVLLNGFEITLTLPGIAGILLSIGMAVDANVIIFARVKEEIGEDKSVKSALKDGFKKATSAIVDGNITTLIAAAVLSVMGSGSVKGFAQTLALGIVVSMFTALFVTRMIIYAFYAVGFTKVGLYGRQKERKTVPFLKRRNVFLAISAVIIIAGAAVMGYNSSKGNEILEYSLDFKGGTATNVTFSEDYSIEDIDAQIVPRIEEITGDVNVQFQKVADSKEIIFKTITLDLEQRKELEAMFETEFYADQDLITSESISSTVSSEMRRDAVLAVAVAGVLMLIYIWFRFKDIRFAGSAVLALMHDVLIVFVFYGVARISVGNTFIACMLTIVGYSINATIVIFDRIREKLKAARKGQDLEVLVNASITDTLTRSIYTSLTTFVMVAVLYIMGVSSIKEFALPLMVGIVCGGYSSVCLTGAIWYMMRKKSYLAEASETDKKKK